MVVPSFLASGIRMMGRRWRMAWQWTMFLAAAGSTLAAPPTYQGREIDRSLEVGYAVRLVDVDGDGRRDIAVVDSKRVIYFANPDWTLRTIIGAVTKPDNVCFAPHDIDGDGKLDFALGADWRFVPDAEGTIQWLRQGSDPKEPWTVHPISAEPYVHRMQWADLKGNGKPSLVVVPLLGRGPTQPERLKNPLRIMAYDIPARPATDRWPAHVVRGDLTVAHNFQPIDFTGDGRLDLVVGSFEGVTLLTPPPASAPPFPWVRTPLGSGLQPETGNRGSSEIKVGRRADRSQYIATIEPWHGDQVVVYTPPAESTSLWKRTVIDADLLWGHAVWCANLDDDADDELIIGVRDSGKMKTPCGVRIYDPPATEGGEWTRTLVDPGGVAVEDLAVDDLDGDGTLEIVAVGRATHNVRIYSASRRSSN